MPFWLHFVLGYFLSVAVVSLSVCTFLMIMSGNPFAFALFVFGFFVTLICAFPGFSIAVLLFNSTSDKSHFPWIASGVLNSVLATVIASLLFGSFIDEIFLLLMLLAGGLGGFAYSQFREQVPYY